MSNEYHGAKLFAIEADRRVATPLFAVLIIVETSDVIFASAASRREDDD